MENLKRFDSSKIAFTLCDLYLICFVLNSKSNNI